MSAALLLCRVSVALAACVSLLLPLRAIHGSLLLSLVVRNCLTRFSLLVLLSLTVALTARVSLLQLLAFQTFSWEQTRQGGSRVGDWQCSYSFSSPSNYDHPLPLPNAVELVR